MNGIWGSGDIPRLDGRMAIVTGASSGVGYEIALQFKESTCCNLALSQWTD